MLHPPPNLGHISTYPDMCHTIYHVIPYTYYYYYYYYYIMYLNLSTCTRQG